MCLNRFTPEYRLKPWIKRTGTTVDFSSSRKGIHHGPGRVRLVGLELIVNRGGSAMTQAPQLRALSAALGTEALGIDLSKPLEAETLAWIHAAFAEHPVLVFGVRT